MSIHVGDCREILRTLPAESVQCVVTSPPYFGLRDYGVAGQIGLEETPEQFIAKLVEVFREVRRVLRDDGTCWVNMGDSYCSTDKWGGGGNVGKQTVAEDGSVPSWAVRQKRQHFEGIKPKDLIGVPWMLAFALRQPYERATIKDKIDRAWLAALVDGEGCMTIFEADNGKGTATSYPPILQVKMCDPECIQHANAITGFEQNLHQASPSTRGNRDTYQWRITGRRAADVAAEIYPYLRIKRKQAVILWNHQMVRDGYETKRGVPMPADAREKQQQCRELIQKLNQKQPVDIPDWMVEPRINVEPGWYLRQDVIWSKPNPMPESVRDRCTKAHEYLFLLAKSERYYFDADAIKEQAAVVWTQTGVGFGHGSEQKPRYKMPDGWATHPGGHGSIHRSGREKGRSARDSFKREGSKREQPIPGQSAGSHRPDREESEWDTGRRNKRSVWTVATQPFKEAHFATYPEALIEPCILAASRPGDTVLDPFLGAGTTAVVAQRLGREWIGCELNPNYAAMADRRIRATQPGLALQVTA